MWLVAGLVRVFTAIILVLCFDYKFVAVFVAGVVACR